METKIIKTLTFENDTETGYQVNAVKLDGYTLTQVQNSISTDNLIQGYDTWLFDCGTSTENV